jgi:hypothetical protein
MTFDEVTRKAAQEAERAVALTMKHLRRKHVYDEDDVSGFFIGSLQTIFDGTELGGVTVNASILRHRRGVAAEERRFGADLLIHVSMDTPTQTYSKGVLIQAKKSEPSDYWSARSHTELVNQCIKILAITPAAFVFNYGKDRIRCGAATRVAGAKVVVAPGYLCRWTSYRFFLELFRCPIGDPRITSANVDDLPVPFVLDIRIAGELTVEEGASLL